MSKVIIIMGSKADLEHCKKISSTLSSFGVESVLRVASAHKVPLKALEIIKEYEQEEVIFITVAGMSNALSGFVDAATFRPVIACPPYSDKFGGADIYSSLRMPSGVCPMVVMSPDLAAMAAVKIFALTNKELAGKISKFQQDRRDELEKDDQAVRQS